MLSIKFAVASALVATGALLSSGAQAAATYCNSAGGAAPLATTDVTFNTVKADNCFGVVDLANQNPGTITNYANNNNLFAPGAWTFITRDDSVSGNSGVGTLGGYNFTIAAANNTNGNPTPSAWALTVTGTPLPFLMDFVVYMHAGSNSAYYFFDNRLISANNTGTFSITFTNGGGNFPGLSGLSVLGRDIAACVPGRDPGCSGGNVSEPGALALLGVSLGIAGWMSRRRRAA